MMHWSSCVVAKSHFYHGVPIHILTVAQKQQHALISILLIKHIMLESIYTLGCLEKEVFLPVKH